MSNDQNPSSTPILGQPTTHEQPASEYNSVCPRVLDGLAKLLPHRPEGLIAMPIPEDSPE